MLERLRQALVLPSKTGSVNPVADSLPEMVVGPLPLLSSSDTADMQIVKELIEEGKLLGLLCEPRRNGFVEGADALDGVDLDQTDNKIQTPQDRVRLTAEEQRQVLLHKAGKRTKSRYELLLHIAMNRQKTVR